MRTTGRSPRAATTTTQRCSSCNSPATAALSKRRAPTRSRARRVSTHPPTATARMTMRTRTTLGLTRAAAGATATSLAPRSPPRSPRRSPRRSPKSPRRDPRRARSPRRTPHPPPRIAWAPSGSTMTTGYCSGPRDRFSSRKIPPW